jgi:hypothetical protein
LCAAHEHHDHETEILARQILEQEEAAAELIVRQLYHTFVV